MASGEVSRADAAFVEGAEQGLLLIQRCADCGVARNPPVPMCGECGSVAQEFEPSPGRGRVLSWIRSRHPNQPDDPPTDVILVQLDEGVRLVSNLVDATGDGPFEDLEVVVDFRPVDGRILPVFRPAGAAS
ncbi:MAG: hypothetical protein JWL73_183 [Actinomycetia bacterium]|nr:hypothetical protein [Actinomycetes bacterium]